MVTVRPVNGLFQHYFDTMIPKISHYCWFGRGEMPQTALDCIDSWHKYMPNWEYKLWNEDNFDVNSQQYTREAYGTKKFAFVSDYVRLKALRDFGGLYLDVDFLVRKPFDDLMNEKAFAGIEGSKRNPVMMGVIASEPNGEWVKEQLTLYDGLHFIKEDGSPDMTPNTSRVLEAMVRNGFIADGKEKYYKDLHIFPTDYFCPRQTTGEYLLTESTYCESIGISSWAHAGKSWKSLIRRIVGQKNMTRLIKLKRRYERIYYYWR